MTLQFQIFLCLILAPAVLCVEDAAFWNQAAQRDLNKILNKAQNTNKAKNVILFLGDGMGIPTVTAARILKGQQQGMPGEENLLSFEKFPHVALIKTYNTNQQTPDSAGTGTAFMSGVKTKAGVIGLDDTLAHHDCQSQMSAQNSKVTTILDWSKENGKSAGVVTTARITDATPASAYAHAASRRWEGDTKLPSNAKLMGCKDIAYQLVMDDENKDIEVLMGGGRQYFMPSSQRDPETSTTSSSQRRDGLDLIQNWKDDKMYKNRSHQYIWNKQQFDSIDPTTTDYLLGLFAHDHMDYAYRRDNGPDGEPSLSAMTMKAIQILRKNDMGFFLLVEGARIDHAHHYSHGPRALNETLEFEKAVQVAVDMTSEEDTLIVAMADHSHTMTISGYPKRGNNIEGLSGSRDRHGHPYPTLLYSNGPGNGHPSGDTSSTHYRNPSGVSLSSETHGGEDVSLYARGPMSHLFSGVHEQNYIAHALAYASCVGSNKAHCADADV